MKFALLCTLRRRISSLSTRVLQCSREKCEVRLTMTSCLKIWGSNRWNWESQLLSSQLKQPTFTDNHFCFKKNLLLFLVFFSFFFFFFFCCCLFFIILLSFFRTALHNKWSLINFTCYTRYIKVSLSYCFQLISGTERGRTRLWAAIHIYKSAAHKCWYTAVYTYLQGWSERQLESLGWGGWGVGGGRGDK